MSDTTKNFIFRVKSSIFNISSISDYLKRVKVNLKIDDILIIKLVIIS